MRPFFISLFILVSTFSFAQTNKRVDHQGLLWTRYVNFLNINKKWGLQSEFDNRIFLSPIKQNLFVIRTVGRYKFNEKIDMGVGFAYFRVNTQNPMRDLDFEIPEYRIQQDITYKDKIGKWTINQRIQEEQRFIMNSSNIALLGSSTFTWRFRYRLQFEYPIWKKNNHYFRALVNDEIMFNVGKNVVHNTFDQNRIYTGLQYGINKNTAIELGYMYNYQRRLSGVDFYERNIIRASIFQKFDL